MHKICDNLLTLFFKSAITKFLRKRFSVGSSFESSLKEALEGGIRDGWLEKWRCWFCIPKAGADAPVVVAVPAAVKSASKIVAKAKGKAEDTR